MAKPFNPAEHPRDPFGRFLAVVRGLKVGEAHTIKTPDGHADITVAAVANGGKREFQVAEGSKITRHGQSAAATRHALSISAKQQHPEALGGEDTYDDLAHYQDINGPGSDPAAKTRKAALKEHNIGDPVWDAEKIDAWKEDLAAAGGKDPGYDPPVGQVNDVREYEPGKYEYFVRWGNKTEGWVRHWALFSEKRFDKHMGNKPKKKPNKAFQARMAKAAAAAKAAEPASDVKKAHGVKLANQHGIGKDLQADIMVNGRKKGTINGYAIHRAAGVETAYIAKAGGLEFRGNELRDVTEQVKEHFAMIAERGEADIREMSLHDLKKERIKLMDKGNDVEVLDAEIARRRADNAEVPADVVKAYQETVTAHERSIEREGAFGNPYAANNRGYLKDFKYDWRAKLTELGLDPDKVQGVGGADYYQKLQDERRDADKDMREARRRLYIELILRNQAFEIVDHADRLDHKPFEIRVKRDAEGGAAGKFGGFDMGQFVAANGAHIRLSRFATRDAAEKAMAKINAKEVLRLQHEKLN